MVVICHLKSTATTSVTDQFDFGDPIWRRYRSEEISPYDRLIVPKNEKSQRFPNKLGKKTKAITTTTELFKNLVPRVINHIQNRDTRSQSQPNKNTREESKRDIPQCSKMPGILKISTHWQNFFILYPFSETFQIFILSTLRLSRWRLPILSIAHCFWPWPSKNVF